jgi:hypothetical protein
VNELHYSHNITTAFLRAPSQRVVPLGGVFHALDQGRTEALDTTPRLTQGADAGHRSNQVMEFFDEIKRIFGVNEPVSQAVAPATYEQLQSRISRGGWLHRDMPTIHGTADVYFEVSEVSRSGRPMEVEVFHVMEAGTNNPIECDIDDMANRVLEAEQDEWDDRDRN